jgi:hypothetical protein
LNDDGSLDELNVSAVDPFRTSQAWPSNACAKLVHDPDRYGNFKLEPGDGDTSVAIRVQLPTLTSL